MDRAAMKMALSRVISLHNGFPVLIKESKNKITKQTILEKIEVEAKSLGVEPTGVAKNLVVTHVRLLAQEIIRGQDCFSELEEFVSTIEFLVAKKVVTGTELEESLLLEPMFLCLPLPAVWRFTCAKIISLEQIIKSLHDNSTGNKLSLVEELLSLVLHKGWGRDSHALVVSDTLAVLVCLAYGGSSEEEQWQPLAKFAGNILHSLTAGLLEVVLARDGDKWPASKQQSNRQPEEPQNHDQKMVSDSSGNDCPSGVMNIYQLIFDNLRVPQEALEGFCGAQLVQILTHHPNLKLSRVLREQEHWRSTQANATLSALLQKLVVGLGHESAVNTLDLVVASEEVNWGCVLTLVATVLNCHHATIARLKEVIERSIRRGCRELEIEPLIIGFLFARHASQEGPHIFPSYAQWFSALFTSEAASPVTKKQSFMFWVRFLMEMVPHEPAHCLRAHLTTHIFTPKGCQETLRSYTYLARARLQELRDALQDSSQRQSSRAKVTEDVEEAVKHFEQTGKISSFVLEASIFREAYFRSSFLPSLLTPRHLPDVPDARARLIEALHTRGKVTPAMLKTYTELCQKEASDLLQGIFIDVEEDLIIEEPMTELSQILEELVTISTHDHQHDAVKGDKTILTIQSQILPILSKVAHKIEEMVKAFDSKEKNSEFLMLDVRTYNEKLVSFQIIECIIGVVKRLCCLSSSSSEGEGGVVRPMWLSQLLSLLTSSVTLQRSLCVYLLHHLTLQHLSQSQLKVDGILLCELSKIEGLFLPVVEGSQPSQKPCPFSSHYLTNLPFDTRQASYHACSILSCWLEWHLACEGDASTIPPQLLYLYLCLAPRLPLVLNHQGDNEATVADVYGYLEGCNVPECSQLYFLEALVGQKIKIPLRTWVQFEQTATWEGVPIHVRQTYLKSRLLGDICVSQSSPSQSPTIDHCTPAPEKTAARGNLVVELVFLFLEFGLRQCNSSDLVMLAQAAVGEEAVGENLCLLEEWHNACSRGAVDSRSVLAFMSICRCLPHAPFLRADRLLEQSGILQTLVDQLMGATDNIQLNLCDTAFLCTSLLRAAASPSARSPQVEQCLRPIKTALVFHWDSLISLLKNHKAIIKRHNCLITLWETLTNLTPDSISSLGPEEAGARLLSMLLTHSSSEENKKKLASVYGGTAYLKWLLAHLGLQLVRGRVPYLPQQDGHLDITEEDRRVIISSQEEMVRFLGVSSATKLAEDLFPNATEPSLAMRLVPMACLLVLLCDGEGQYGGSSRNTAANTKRLDVNQLDLLLQCYVFLSQVFDSQDSEDNSNHNEDSTTRDPKATSPQRHNSWKERCTPHLSYLAQVNLEIFSLLSTLSTTILGSLPKATLLKCDSEVRATVYSRLQGTKK